MAWGSGELGRRRQGVRTRSEVKRADARLQNLRGVAAVWHRGQLLEVGAAEGDLSPRNGFRVRVEETQRFLIGFPEVPAETLWFHSHGFISCCEGISEPSRVYMYVYISMSRTRPPSSLQAPSLANLDVPARISSLWYMSRGTFHVPSFPGCFLESLQNPRENRWIPQPKRRSACLLVYR